MAVSRYKLPLIPLRGITVFPGMVLHFDVGRPKSIAAVEEAMRRDKLVFLCYQSNIMLEDPKKADLAKIGTIAEIRQILRMPDGNCRVLVEGQLRGEITRFHDDDNFVEVNVAERADIPCYDDLAIQVLIRKLQHLMEDFLEVYDRLSPEAIVSLLEIDEPGELSDIVTSNLPVKPQLKQSILNELDVRIRLEKLIAILEEELAILRIEKEVMDKVQDNLDNNQRDYVLREKLKVIKEELGNAEGADYDIEKYRKAMAERNFPEYVSEKLEEELDRLYKTQPHSQEYSVIQNYIETVISIPWEISTDEQVSVSTAKKILDRDHYGLEKVKTRILEHIAVKQLKPDAQGSILCLVGPPGTGKTSIAKSLAEALNKKYVRISLGGVQNEAEIRGHRKTYVGAMPGRIIDAIKRAGSNNPLILLDEIDKMSSDYHGDPASAMLEVLDPEQNVSFRDHFMELNFDLSNVMFVTTANTLDTVPKPLLDRMEVIRLEGYTSDEKLQIAKKYLLPKQKDKNGLKPSNLRLTDTIINDIISSYTCESGVRGLEKRLASICRKVAKEIVEDNISSVSVNKKTLSKYLGAPVYTYDKVDHKNKVGVATGLAWTENGGDTLFIEVTTMEGTGKLELTGNLGDVMKESAKIALSYVRANVRLLGIDSDFYKKLDIHIHVPEGAVPKDGPSAGITMATALSSALSGRAVKSDIAMTGEVTLRGRVMPIGGLKEKSLAALRMGIKKMIIPADNKPNFEELPDVVKENIEFIFAKEMHTVLSHALEESQHKEHHNNSVQFINPKLDIDIKSPVNRIN